ncbi:envelope integrity protein Cei [Pseudonocardia sp. GCM10023141]|uniref:envelope integrity protein Cei n=1 Tax=Pseudonocardia sp. GCM10023141 TaxID=3252653 RepID=UPI003608F84C
MGTPTRPYQRRRRRPVAILVAVLAVLAVATWTVVLVAASGSSGAGKCPVPVAGPAVGEALARDALTAVAPTAPSSVPVLVINGGGQRGQANLVAAQLGDLGFAQSAPPGNDPFFADGTLKCVGQIRFGKAGAAGASTLALVVPCAELMRDGRADTTVDLAVGTSFRDLNPTKAVRDALSHLTVPGGGSDGAGNADPGAADNPQAGIDPATLATLRATTC